LRKTQCEQLPLRDDSMLPLRQHHNLPFAAHPVSPPDLACLTWTTHTGG
jgi:hypothetical protein